MYRQFVCDANRRKRWEMHILKLILVWNVPKAQKCWNKVKWHTIKNKYLDQGTHYMKYLLKSYILRPEKGALYFKNLQLKKYCSNLCKLNWINSSTLFLVTLILFCSSKCHSFWEMKVLKFLVQKTKSGQSLFNLFTLSK